MQKIQSTVMHSIEQVLAFMMGMLLSVDALIPSFTFLKYQPGERTFTESGSVSITRLFPTVSVANGLTSGR